METGLLQLFVVAGSTPLSIASATVRAELRLLDVSISQQIASSVLWTSDSSLLFSLPPGAGPNKTVRVQVSDQFSNMLTGLAYPFPKVDPAKFSIVATTGVAQIEIVGQYFSHRSATVSVRLGVSSCSGSNWISDVSVVCRNAAGSGLLRNIITTVELLHSSEAGFVDNITSSSLSSFQFINKMMKSATPWIATDSALFTGGIQLIVFGQQFGVVGVTFGMRIGASSSRATFWISDTSTTNRVGQRSNGMNWPFTLSALSLQASAKLAPDPLLLSFHMLSVAPRNIPRTGAFMLTLSGGHFALHSTTMALRTGYSACQLSLWSSDTSLKCKTSSFMASSGSSFSLTMASLVSSREILTINHVQTSGRVMFSFQTSGNVSDSNASFVLLRDSFPAQIVLIGITAADELLWTSSSSLGFKFGKMPSQNEQFMKLKIGFDLMELLYFEAPSSLYVPRNYALASSINIRASSPFASNFETSNWAQKEFRVGQLYDFSVSIFNNNSQPFHDNGKLLAVTFLVKVELLFSNGTILSGAFCQGLSSHSFFQMRLDAGTTEITSSSTEIVFCSEFSGAYIQFSISGEVEGIVQFNDVFHISKLNAIGQNPIKSVRLATKMPFQIESNTRQTSYEVMVESDIFCSKTAFVITASLMCDSPTTMFVVNGTESGSIVSTLYKTCQWKVPEWMIYKVSICAVKFSINGFIPEVRAISDTFTIIPGELFFIEESLAFNHSFASGDIIFNKIDESGNKCLEAVLFDKQHNKIIDLATSVELSASSNGVLYSIGGQLKSSISLDAHVLWCEATSTIRSSFVMPIFFCEFFSLKTLKTKRIQSSGRFLFNVTGVGESKSLELHTLAEIASNGTIMVIENSLPVIQLQYFDLFGNAKLFASDLAIRIRFQQVFNVTSRRRLLFDNKFALKKSDLHRCSDTSDMIVKAKPVQVSEGTVGAVFSVDNLTVCAQGETIIDIDLVNISSVQFQIVASSLFSIKLLVQIGVAKFIMLSSCSGLQPVVLDSYTDSHEFFCLIILDNGYNEVFGFAEVAIDCQNTTFFLAPQHMFSINSSLTVLNRMWLWAEFRNYTKLQSEMFISSSNLIPLKYSVAIVLRASCKPGTYVDKQINNSHALCKECQPGYFAKFYDELRCYPCQPGYETDNQKASCRLCPVDWYNPYPGQDKCVRCGTNEFSNQQRTTCFSLHFQRELPDVLISMVPYLIPPLQVYDAVRKTISGVEEPLNFEIACVCVQVANCTSSPNATLFLWQNQIQEGRSASDELEIIQRVARSNVGDNWQLQITSKSNAQFVVMQIRMPGLIRVLGSQPILQTVIPSLVPSAYLSVITIFGALLETNQVSRRCNPSCVFLRRGSSSRSEVSVYSPITNETQGVYVMCETNFPGSIWIDDEILLNVKLSDCRYSTSNFSIKMFCPKNYYQSIMALNHRCEPCPKPMSVSLRINEQKIENCICNIGFYGTFGGNCIKCPNHPGFNCSMYGSLVPRILPGEREKLEKTNDQHSLPTGFYIEFEKMNLCSSESSQCPAIVKCPFAHACPGMTEKNCAGDSMQVSIINGQNLAIINSIK
jgi:hypothetical protein